MPQPLRRLLLIVAALISVAPASASATTFCVPSFSAACPNSGGNVAQANLETAMTTSGSDGTPDTIIIGSGFFTTSSTFSPTGSDALTLIGAGAGNTFLGTTSANNVFVMSLFSRGPTTIRNLTLVVGETLPDNAGSALGADAGTALQDVTVDVRNPPSAGGIGSDGLSFAGGASTLERVRITTSGTGAVSKPLRIGTISGTSVTATDLTIESARSTAIDLDAGAQLTANRVVLLGLTNTGVLARPGVASLTNALIVGDANALMVTASAPGGIDASVTLDHATVVATAPSVQPPISATSNAAGDATVTVTNSIVTGFSSGGQRAASGAGLARFIASHSYLPGAVGGNVPGGVTLSSMVATPPSFTSPADTDFSLAADSSAIDAGTPGTAVPSIDLNGNARVVDGDGDGTAVRDLGAYERAAPTPAATPAPSPAPTPGTPPGGSVSTPTPSPAPTLDRTAPETRRVSGPGKRLAQRIATFRFGANEPGVRFQCRLDRAKRYRACASPLTLRRLTAGKHVLRVRAIDRAGNRDATPLVLRFTVPRRSR